jgi:hypothetical protein
MNWTMEDTPHQISARTTPTWELELLISGATVFGMLQLPGKLSEWFVTWLNSADEAMVSFVIPLGIYLQFSALMLAMTFVLHLCLRGYWVALVGLNSVYPEGVKWEKLKLGPYSLEANRLAAGGMADRIEVADNRATRVFAIGFGIAMFMLAPIVLVGILLIVTFIVQWLGWNEKTAQVIFWVAFALLATPVLLAVFIDRHFGARLPREGTLARLLRGILLAYARVGMSRTGNPLIALYTSYIGRRKAGFVLVGLMLPALFFSFLMLMGSRLDAASMSFVGLPSDRMESTHRLDVRHYDSLRGDAATLDPQPTIADPVVSGPYLKLFIPYVPRRYNPALAKACPETIPARNTDGAAALACLRKLQPLSLDGKVIEAPWLISQDPRTGQRGMVVMIAVSKLEEGAHELVLAPLPKAEDAQREPKAVRIAFWK